MNAPTRGRRHAGNAPAAQPPLPPLPPGLPHVAYVLLWFPLSSETFIFREIVQLREQGLDIHVYTMYGAAFRGCSREMRAYDGPVRRLGMRAFFRIWGAFFRALRRRPGLVLRLLREGFFRRMRNLESLGENLWCFMAGFLLAECCRRDKVELIHSSWANGPAGKTPRRALHPHQQRRQCELAAAFLPQGGGRQGAAHLQQPHLHRA